MSIVEVKKQPNTSVVEVLEGGIVLNQTTGLYFRTNATGLAILCSLNEQWHTVQWIMANAGFQLEETSDNQIDEIQAFLQSAAAAGVVSAR